MINIVYHLHYGQASRFTSTEPKLEIIQYAFGFQKAS